MSYFSANQAPGPVLDRVLGRDEMVPWETRDQVDSLYDHVARFFHELQTEICAALEAADGSTSFASEPRTRDESSGESRLMVDGTVFEKASVDWSRTAGQLSERLASQLPGDGREFRATGVSLAIHPLSPMVPMAHAEFHYIERGAHQWFTGGSDLTPCYFFRDDVVLFHRLLREACLRHPQVADYRRFKKTCDEYLYLPHRGETRGVGGIFFEALADRAGRGDRSGQDRGRGDESDDMDAVFEFVMDIGRAFLPSYTPIVERRRDEEYGDTERRWQLSRRARYVEFDLLHDRSTAFRLDTDGGADAIQRNLPPLVRWDNEMPSESGSREALMISMLQPVDWLGLDG